MEYRSTKYDSGIHAIGDSTNRLKKAFTRFLIFVFGFGAAFLVVFLAGKHSASDSLKTSEEIEYLLTQVDLFNKQINEIDSVMGIVQYHDDKIYRLMVGLESLPTGIRNAGFGGFNRYASMEGYANSKTVVATSQKMDILLTQLYIQLKSYDEIYEFAVLNSPKLDFFPAVQPIQNATPESIHCGFGESIHPILETEVMHMGIDYAIPVQTNVIATGGGIIEEARYSPKQYGYYVTINHGNDYKTRYANLNRILVHQGDSILRGDLIGLSGSSGFSVEPHLHYEVLRKNQPVDPIHYFFLEVPPENLSQISAIIDNDNTPLD